jgi:hypothetical protein
MILHSASKHLPSYELIVSSVTKGSPPSPRQRLREL